MGSAGNTVRYENVTDVKLKIEQDGDETSWIYKNESDVAIYSDTLINVVNDEITQVTVEISAPEDSSGKSYVICGVQPESGWMYQREPCSDFVTGPLTYTVTTEVEHNFTVRIADKDDAEMKSVRVDPVFKLKKSSTTGGK